MRVREVSRCKPRTWHLPTWIQVYPARDLFKIKKLCEAFLGSIHMEHICRRYKGRPSNRVTLDKLTRTVYIKNTNLDLAIRDTRLAKSVLKLGLSFYPGQRFPCKHFGSPSRVNTVNNSMNNKWMVDVLRLNF